jgi:hypothetical protein
MFFIICINWMDYLTAEVRYIIHTTPTSLRSRKECPWINPLHFSLQLLHFPLLPAFIYCPLFFQPFCIQEYAHMITLSNKKHVVWLTQPRGWRGMQQ